MYSSEKNPGINWKDLIIKAIFLVVFLLLLVWLFPKTPNMKPFYSNVFRENIKYMQDAAESYYTNEKLPKNIGDTAELTLQEMINKNIILPFVDKDGKECDTYSSYVQVKKNKNDYTLKVNLVCPTESDFVEKTLGCYTYCDNCEEEVEYQFRKELTSNRTTYSCPKGGSLNGTTCTIYNTNSYKATETTSKGEEYCPKGGVLKDGKCYVEDIKVTAAKVSKGEEYCPDGGSLSNGICYVNGSSYKASVSVTGGEYYCPSGTLTGNKCVVSGSYTSVPATIKSYTCPDGKTQSSPNCKVTSTTQKPSYKATAKTGKTYLSGTYTKKPSGATCSTATEYVCTSKNNCPGYVTVYTSCYKNTTTYSCPKGGNPNGNMCVFASTTSTTTKTGTPNYSCSTGTPNGKYCIVRTEDLVYPASKTEESKEKYCPRGGYLSNGRCITKESYTYKASKESDTKYCTTGDLRNGKCVVDNSYTYNASKTDGKLTITCPNGGELKDKTCYLSQVASTYPATASTKKVTSYSYKWSKEEEIAGWTKTGETRKVASSAADKK